MEKAKLGLDDGLIQSCAEPTSEAGEAAVRRLLERRRDFTALYVDYVLKAHGVLKVLKEMSIRVPQDLSVATFNLGDAGSHEDPPLATVDVPRREVGAAAVALLLDLASGRVKAPATRYVPYLVVRGASIGAPADVSKR